MMAVRRLSRTHPAYMKHSDHQRLWNIVEGAVADAFASHKDYLTERGERLAVGSIVKRVVGQLVGHAKQTREGGRLGDCNAGPPASLGLIASNRDACSPDEEAGRERPCECGRSLPGEALR